MFLNFIKKDHMSHFRDCSLLVHKYIKVRCVQDACINSVLVAPSADSLSDLQDAKISFDSLLVDNHLWDKKLN